MIHFGVIEHIDKSKTGFFIRGHANYAKHGADIVCAAVSAIGQTAAIGVGKFDDGAAIKHCRAGYISFVCAKTPETKAIISTAMAGLNEIAKEYPANVREVV